MPDPMTIEVRADQTICLLFDQNFRSSSPRYNERMRDTSAAAAVIADAIRAAVEQERDACAKTQCAYCDLGWTITTDGDHHVRDGVYRRCEARDIRGRPTPPPVQAPSEDNQ